MIDTHAHVFHRGLSLSPDRRYTPNYDAWSEKYISLLDRHGVANGVLVPVSILGANNDYLVETVCASNGRLKGLVTLDPLRDVEKIAAWDSAGICGIRLNLKGLPLPDLRSQSWREALATCRKHGWLVQVNDAAQRLSKTVPSLLDAGLPVVIDHFGNPDRLKGTADPGFRYLCELGATARVWVKMSAPYRIGYAHAAQAASMLRCAYAPEQLLWASDWPFTGYEASGLDYGKTCAFMRDWVNDDADRHQIMHLSAQRLFGFVPQIVAS